MQDTCRNIFMLKNWISKALQLNKRICSIMASINQNLENFAKDDIIDLSTNSNLKLLHDPEVLKSKVNLNNHHDLIKQRSELWFEIQKKAYVTGSTIYKSLGLDNLKNQKKHFDEFVLKRKPEEPNKSVQDRMQHGTDNEVSVVLLMI